MAASFSAAAALSQLHRLLPGGPCLAGPGLRRALCTCALQPRTHLRPRAVACAAMHALARMPAVARSTAIGKSSGGSYKV